MAKGLTPITIQNLRPRPERYEVSDGGCQGLRLVVFPSKAKSFVVRFRYKGKPQKLTLGPALIGAAEAEGTAELDTPLTLLTARELATKALRQAKSGIDPSAAKRRQQAEQEQRQEQQADDDTFKAVAELYLKLEGPKQRSYKKRRSDYELLYKSLGPLPIATIKQSHYRKRLDEIAEHAPKRHDRVLGAVTTLLNWHAGRCDDFTPPMLKGLRRYSAEDLQRSRFLSDDELRTLWITVDKSPDTFGRCMQFILLNANRRSEAAEISRKELLSPDTWVIPAARYKTEVDMLIPLSEPAQQIIRQQPRWNSSDFVFSLTGNGPLRSISRFKKIFDEACGLKDYRTHDLRRTARTLMSRAGILPDIAERCLGHVIGGVRGTYDVYAYEADKRRAFKVLAAQIALIVYPQADNQVDADVAARRIKVDNLNDAQLDLLIDRLLKPSQPKTAVVDLAEKRKRRRA